MIPGARTVECGMTKQALQNEGFSALGLDRRIVEALTTLGY